MNQCLNLLPYDPTLLLSSSLNSLTGRFVVTAHFNMLLDGQRCSVLRFIPVATRSCQMSNHRTVDVACGAKMFLFQALKNSPARSQSKASNKANKEGTFCRCETQLGHWPFGCLRS